MMMLKNQNNNHRNILGLQLFLVAITITCLIVVILKSQDINNRSHHDVITIEQSTLDKIKETKTLRVGYGGFPPYTIVDPNNPDKNSRVTGFAADIIDEIVTRSDGMIENVEWVNLNWETFNADMDSRKFDVLVDAVYYTVPKALNYSYTIPYSYFGTNCAIVLIDDNRFESFEDLNNPDIKITHAIGYTSADFALNTLDKPEFIPVGVGENPYSQMDYVISGRADVAIQDVPSVVQYANEHSSKVKALFVDNPPALLPGSFVCRNEDQDLVEFLNTCLRIFQTDGTINQLDKKWNSLGYYDLIELQPGAGLISN